MVVSTLATVTVKRNEYVPTFFPIQYSARVSEHAAIGTNITEVSATDQDLPVSHSFNMEFYGYLYQSQNCLQTVKLKLWWPLHLWES